MKKHLIILGIAVLLLAVGLSGCSEVPVSGKSPANINQFASVQEGELIRFYFLLEDKGGINTVSDGNVQIEIFDDLNQSLYYKEFEVKASEFVDYVFQLTGTGIGKAYEWRIPIGDIEKGTSILGFGRATLTFTTPDDKTLNAENTLVPIHSYTEEELENMYEAEYEDSSTAIDKIITKGNFEITVRKVGYFNSLLFGVTNQYFRVDMEVKNVGSVSEYFLPSGLAIIDSQSIQYEYTYGGTLDTLSTVYPDVMIKGYLLFEDVPKTETSLRLLFELGYDEYFNPYLFEYNINLL